MPITDFSKTELETVRQVLDGRWRGVDIELHLADVETRATSGEGVVECPAVFWQHQGCNYVVIKTGTNCFRCHFFYQPNEQFGTGIEHYDELETCLIALLQVQADDASLRSGAFPG